MRCLLRPILQTKLMNKRIKRITLYALIGALLLGGITAVYLFNLPHRDVANSSADFEVSAADLVNTYLDDPSAANERFLSEDGDSKILAITGNIKAIETNFNGETLLILAGEAGKTDVQIQLVDATALEQLVVGNKVLIKGAITSGAEYDADLDLYTPVTIAQGSLIQN